MATAPRIDHVELPAVDAAADPYQADRPLPAGIPPESEHEADAPLPPGVSRIMAQRLGPDGWRDTAVHVFHLKDGSSRELTDAERLADQAPAWWDQIDQDFGKIPAVGSFGGDA